MKRERKWNQAYNTGLFKNVHTWKFINPLQPSGNYMYRQFNIQQF